jgi:hypothetical protein
MAASWLEMTRAASRARRQGWSKREVHQFMRRLQVHLDSLIAKLVGVLPHSSCSTSSHASTTLACVYGTCIYY